MGLGDAALIKDNHIAAAGGVTAAFRAVLAAAPGVVVEVECDTLDQVGEALAAGAALILLDNMSLDQMRSAVAMARAYPAAKLEASGGLRLETAREVASTGVHYLSVGALTHSSPALDLALDVGLPAYRGHRHADVRVVEQALRRRDLVVSSDAPRGWVSTNGLRGYGCPKVPLTLV